MKKDYISKKAIGVYSASAFSGLEVLEIENGINDYVIVREWVHSYDDPGEKEKIHRLMLYSTDKGFYFNFYGIRYYLNDFIRV